MWKKLILLLFIPLLLTSCSSQTTPEEEIREFIAGIEKSFEKRQAGSLKEYISDTYRDDYGNTKRDIIRFAAGYILRHPVIHIKTKLTKLEVSENTNSAKIKIDVAVSNEPLQENDIRFLHAEFHRFFINLEKSKDWKLRSLKWQQSTIDEYLEVK